ncbi:MAG: protein CysJ, partial [Neobacillus sp.]|nr:protein CysJ [Neobacillus sp.]
MLKDTSDILLLCYFLFIILLGVETTMQLTLENTKNTKGDKLPFSRTNPFQAKVLKNINLNGSGSSKETRHIELSLNGSGLSYNPGDALGIVPSNDPELVASILEE